MVNPHSSKIAGAVVLLETLEYVEEAHGADGAGGRSATRLSIGVLAVCCTPVGMQVFRGIVRCPIAAPLQGVTLSSAFWLIFSHG